MRSNIKLDVNEEQDPETMIIVISTSVKSSKNGISNVSNINEIIEKENHKPEKAKVGPFGKMKTRNVLLSKRFRVYDYYSNSIMGFCFLLYVVAVYTLQMPYLYRLYIFYLVSGRFVSETGPPT